MLKANAYGHGLRSCAKFLDKRIDYIGVASIDEALALRKSGCLSSIVLMEGVFTPDEYALASEYHLELVFHSAEQIQWLKDSQLTGTLKAWLKLDSGMGRLGFDERTMRWAHQTLLDHPNIESNHTILTHLACADEKQHPKNQSQLTRFHSACQSLDPHQQHPVSVCNSAAVFHFPSHHHQVIRPGIALYGVSPFQNLSAQALNLKPVMTLHSELIAIRKACAGDTLGYGGRGVCEIDMPMGIIALGYGDGYPQNAPNGTPVLVGNTLCPLLGQVSMDMMSVDLRPSPQAKVGDPVTLWGETLPIELIAKQTQRSAYELLSGVQHRVRFQWETT